MPTAPIITPSGDRHTVGDPDDVLVSPGEDFLGTGDGGDRHGTLADSDGTLVGGPYEPLLGYVGVPSTFTDLVGPDGYILADPNAILVSDPIDTDAALIAGNVPFILVDIDISRPAAALDYAYGWGSAPWGAVSLLAAAAEDTETLHTSDIGYRTETPVIPYPPRISGGFTLDARIPLAPAQTGIVYGWGTLSVINADHEYDGVVAAWNVEGRNVVVKYGVKAWDDTRGIFIDPIADDLTTIFTGVASGWSLDEFKLDIPLRDASYWLDLPFQRNLYAGTGTYEGDAALANVPKPKTRGIAYNVTPVLVDRDNLIYQYNDAAGTVTALYEGGATTITFSSDTTDLYTGSTSSGQYRTDNSRGLFQLGAEPADNAAITADVTGNFPTAGSQLIAANIIRYMLTEDMDIPAGYVDTASFTTAATDYAYQAGWYFGPDDRVSGEEAVGRALSSFGARIVPAVSGALQCFILEAPSDADAVLASYTEANILRCEPRAIANEVTPATYRVRCAYQHNNTVQTSGLIGSTTEAHRQFVQTADRYASWTDSAVSTGYATAKDLPPFGGGLTTEADAQAVADRIGALFGTRRWQFDLTLPIVEAVDREFGDTIIATYPNHVMTTGARGKIVGRSFNTTDLTITLTVLV